MTSKSCRTALTPTLWAGALALSLVAAPPAGAADGDAPAAAPEAAKTESVRTVTVGKATLHWHLASKATPAQRAELAAAFKQVTAAHLTGGEPLVTAMAEPVVLPGGQRMLPLPVELIHTMFVGPGGQEYCSDSTVTVKAAAVPSADGEGR